MVSLKDRISSPLEAGLSILDANVLPPHMTSALEYTSRRLARKSLHITLVVVRRDYQLPGHAGSVSISNATNALPVPLSPPASPPTSISAASTPSRSGFASPVAAIKRLVRSGTLHNLGGVDRPGVKALQRSKTVASPCNSLSSSADASSPRLRWPLSPLIPSTPRAPATPLTPATPASVTTASSTAGTECSAGMLQQAPESFGLRLVHASPLTYKMEKILRGAIERAGKKFCIRAEWFPAAVSPAAYKLSPDLIQRSIVQNEVLFQGEGLTLLSLDHMYTFKSALASYASTGSGFRLEDAVDELRRYVLSNSRRKLKKSLLVSSYGWLGLRDSALSDVSRMYRRAYGGPEKDPGIENDLGIAVSPLPPTPPPKSSTIDASNGDHDEEGVDDIMTPTEALKPHFAPEDVKGVIAVEKKEERQQETEVDIKETDDQATTPTEPVKMQQVEAQTEQLKLPTQTPSPSAGLKGPALKLQTTFFAKPVPKRIIPKGEPESPQTLSSDIKIDFAELVGGQDEDDDADAELTARPKTGGAFGWSIDEMLDVHSPLQDDARMSRQIGVPMTPNGYEDISPITRGEWGFLMVSDPFKTKTAVVETCV